MAEKKYIGKPGKQDDPCWKGYEMVGMKKKGGRQVPNCVPEATDIIAKAKAAVAKKAGAKLKLDPDTGTPDHFTAAMRRKKGLPEETEIDEGVTNPEIKKAYADLIKTPSGSSERKSAIRRYKSLRQNAVKEETELEEKRGLWDNIHAKRKRIKAGSGERMRKPGSEGAPTAAALKASQTEEVNIDKYADSLIKRDKQNLSKSHVVHAARVAGVDHKKLISAVQQKVGRIKEESEIEEAYGMWKVDFPKQHAGKAVAAGSVHVKAQNTAHAHKVAAKRVGVDHKMFKSKVTKSSILPEELEQVNEYNNYRKAGKDPFAARKQYMAMDRAEKKGVMPGSSTSTADAIAAFKAKGGKITKLDTKGNMKEELGKSNEWGTDALRKKYAAMTPGQESMAADKIPSFDPRYDNVTTQHLGLHPVREGYLAEISAKASIARDEFRRKMQKALTDPKNIARAKKVLAKKKEAEKAKEAPHLVMQLRKVVSIGSKVQFQDGQHHTIAPNHADVFMNKYNSAKSSIEKEALQKRAHKSHAEFMRTIAEEAHENCGTPDCCQMCDTAEMGTHHVDSYEAHKGSGDQISPVISHDDEDIRFQDFDEEAFEKELEADVLALSWDDLVDLYDEDEIEYDDSPETEEGEELEEGITPAGRLKKKFNAMRTKSRRMMARNIAIKRVSSPEKLKSRSIRAARRMVYKRLLRNRDISTVSSSEKTRLEAQIKRMAPMVARLSVRVMPAVRKLEQSRIKNSRTRKKK